MTRVDLTKLLEAMLAASPRTSDINFTVGRPPQTEIDGVLRPFGTREPLTPEQTEDVARQIIRGDPNLAATLEETGSCDCAYVVPDGTRFRANVFTARGHRAAVMRVLPSEIPSINSLGLPTVLEEIPRLKNGLVLVTGGTGSGKSTSLAAVIDGINRERAVHIVTLEDPIEFRHPHKKATINQRELGTDYGEFMDGLRAALRQAPKVILIGEMRDAETVEIALKASETGHLVLSTLHTIDAGQTINRIAGMFDISEQRLVRSRLSQVLRFVVAQRLLPKQGGGRVAALEIMGANLRTRELIQNGETEDKTFYNIIAESRPFGWQTFDQHIVELYAEGKIDEESAMAYGSDRSVLRAEIDRVRASKGEDTSDLGDLEMDFVRRLR